MIFHFKGDDTMKKLLFMIINPKVEFSNLIETLSKEDYVIELIKGSDESFMIFVDSLEKLYQIIELTGKALTVDLLCDEPTIIL
jgi:hypothetical protein